jgi:internalin A
VATRDKDEMKHGDRISDFMDRIGEGDLVYVFLSDKYLKSPFCMYELHAIWRNGRGRVPATRAELRRFAS